MNIIIKIIQEYNWIFILAFIVLFIILIFLEILNRIEYNRLEKRYKKMMRGSSGKTIEELIYEYTGKIEGALENVDRIESDYKEIGAMLKKCIQKYSILRYRAFDDVGSDLSFSIALLDDNNDGVVLTGIYGRDDSTVFAKPIERGISKYDLSDEEKQVLKDAMGEK